MAIKDLFVLVADQDMVETLKALLSRHQSLRIRPITHQVERHLKRDPGCRMDAVRSLRPRLHHYHRAIVVLDRHGCGDSSSRETIQGKIEGPLASNGWDDRAKAIVIDPELEAWVWAGSTHVADVLGWKGHYEDLKTWLVDRGLWRAGAAKPSDPKAAMKAALQERNITNSATLFRDLAKRTTWQQCQCPAFAELTQTLSRWFPAPEQP